MPSTKQATSSKGVPRTPRFVNEDELRAVNDLIRARICEQAYRIFEASGGQPGKDQENWLKAEAAVLQHNLEVRESGSWLAINGSLPNISADDVQIYVEPRRVIVRANRGEMSNGSEGEQPNGEMFLVADLAVEAEPPTATASLKDQKLLLMVKKRLPGNEISGKM